MFKKLPFFRKSPEEREFDCFMKSYTSLFFEENHYRRESCHVSSENCRFIVLKVNPNQDNPIDVYDSSEKIKHSKQSSNNKGCENSIHIHATKAIAELAFGHLKLKSKNSSSSMKVHTFPNSDNVMFSLVCRVRKMNNNHQNHHSHPPSASSASSSLSTRNNNNIKKNDVTLSIPTNCFCPRDIIEYQHNLLSSSPSSSIMSRPLSPPIATTTMYIPQLNTTHCQDYATSPAWSCYSINDTTTTSALSIGGCGTTTSGYGGVMHNSETIFSTSPGNRARLMRSLTSALISRPSTPANNNNHETNTQIFCIDDINNPSTTLLSSAASINNGYREYLAICILCSPPDCFHDLSISPLCSRTQWICTELNLHKFVIQRRWRNLLGSPFLRYLFQHIVLIESLLHYCVHSTHLIHQFSSSSNITSSSSASASNSSASLLFNHSGFVSSFTDLYQHILQRLSDLLFAPRLRNPIWLSLTANDKQRADGSGVSTRQFESTKIFVRECLLKMIQRFHDNVKFGKKGFLCRLLTGVLTHHPFWVSTVLPAGGKLSKKHLSKHKATWVENLMQCNPYSAEWAQLNDLYGGISSLLDGNEKNKRTFCRTIVIGKNVKVVNCLLYLLSYFIRCSNTNVTEERVPEFCRGDILDMREKRRKRSASTQGSTGCPSPVAGDSGVSSSQEDISNGQNVCPVWLSMGQTILPSSSLPSASGGVGGGGSGSCSSGVGGGDNNNFSGRVSRSGSSCALQKACALTEEKKQIAKALAMDYSQTSNFNTRAHVQFMNENFMEVPLLIENTRLTSVELWDKLCPELLSSSHLHADPAQIEDTHITLGGCLPLTPSLAHSLYGTCTSKYLEGSGLVLQGTTEPLTNWEHKLKVDIEMAVLHHCPLDEPVGHAIALVADCDTGMVKNFSFTLQHGHTETSCLGSALVLRLLESARLLGEADMPTDILLKRVESCLADIYYRSTCLANVLYTATSPLDQIIHEKNIYHMLGLEAEDVPLLKSVAHLIRQL